MLLQECYEITSKAPNDLMFLINYCTKLMDYNLFTCKYLQNDPNCLVKLYIFLFQHKSGWQDDTYQ